MDGSFLWLTPHMPADDDNWERFEPYMERLAQTSALHGEVLACDDRDPMKKRILELSRKMYTNLHNDWSVRSSLYSKVAYWEEVVAHHVWVASATLFNEYGFVDVKGANKANLLVMTPPSPHIPRRVVIESLTTAQVLHLGAPYPVSPWAYSYRLKQGMSPEVALMYAARGVENEYGIDEMKIKRGVRNYIKQLDTKSNRALRAWVLGVPRRSEEFVRGEVLDSWDAVVRAIASVRAKPMSFEQNLASSAALHRLYPLQKGIGELEGLGIAPAPAGQVYVGIPSQAMWDYIAEDTWTFPYDERFSPTYTKLIEIAKWTEDDMEAMLASGADVWEATTERLLAQHTLGTRPKQELKEAAQEYVKLAPKEYW